MQWGQRLQCFQIINDRVVDDRRRDELRTAVHDPVADGSNLKGIELARESAQRPLHRLVAATGLEIYLAAGQTFTRDNTVDRSIHRVLQRCGSGVQYEDAVARHGTTLACVWNASKPWLLPITDTELIRANGHQPRGDLGRRSVTMKSRKTLVEMPQQRKAPMTEEERREAIAKAAYYLAEQRGFEPGHEVEDWIAAEARVNAAPDGR